MILKYHLWVSHLSHSLELFVKNTDSFMNKQVTVHMNESLHRLLNQFINQLDFLSKK